MALSGPPKWMKMQPLTRFNRERRERVAGVIFD